MDNLQYSRKATLSMKITEFEVPPMQDLLIIGKRAPIGPEAVRQMAEFMSPEQFTIIRMDHDRVEAILVRKSILNMLNEDILIKVVLEEADRVINETSVLRSEIKLALLVQREVELK